MFAESLNSGAPSIRSRLAVGLLLAAAASIPLDGGTVTATWLVLAADPAKVESWTFPLLVENAATADLNTIQVAGSLAPAPRYRDFSAPQKLTNLRITTILLPALPGASLVWVAARALLTGHTSVALGSNVTSNSQLINDTSDPTQQAANVTIRDNLPTGLSLVSCTAGGPSGSGATCTTGAGNQVQLNCGTPAAGQSASVTVAAQLDPSLAAGTVVENPVSAASDEVNLDLFASTSSVSFIVPPGTPAAIGGTPASGSGGS